ncbi:MAG: hypothetical protein L6V78_02570 [Clostridium sp.]|nr:MAG: hypothetical protein L6V78_02570 [Clostridium sp.]
MKLKKDAVAVKEQSLNKLNEVKEEAKKRNQQHNRRKKLDVQRCKYCHKYFDKGLTVCPHCRKNQNINAVGIITSILIALFALLMLFTYFYMNKHANKTTPGEYKSTCVLVSYEDLIEIT